MFIRVFNSEVEANEFAQQVMGVLSIRYNWSDMLCRIIREYVVKY